jgi:predicted phage terminase large subunit-like protein
MGTPKNQGRSVMLYDPSDPHDPRRRSPSEFFEEEIWDLQAQCATLRGFVKAAWHVLEPGTALIWGPHLDAVCDHVEAVIVGEDVRNVAGLPWSQNLRINVPPGTMKSLILAVFAPAWMWIKRPDWRVICASGNPRVVERDASKCRDLLKSEWYQRVFAPSWKFADDSDAKLLFRNTAKGFRQGVTVAAPITGDRADCLIIDDPNDAADVVSKAERDRVNYWYTYAFANRVNNLDKSTRLIIMQRLHEEDLTGYLTATEGDNWAHLLIPMEFEPDGPSTKPTFLGWTDRRSVDGESICPIRFTEKSLAGEKRRMGAAGYAGQYQQRPSPAEGNKYLRTWWRFWREDGAPIKQTRPKGCNDYDAMIVPKAFDEVLESWDLTFKGALQNDWVVGIKVGRLGAKKFILGRIRRKMGFGKAKEAIFELHGRPPLAWEVIVEDKANGPAVIEELQKDMAGLIPVDPRGGKEARSAIVEPQVEAGDWYLPDGATWLEEWIDEFATFPNAKHDDQVDALSQAGVRLSAASAALAYAQAMCSK